MLRIEIIEWIICVRKIWDRSGTASFVYVKGKGHVLNEPLCVAMDKNTGKLLRWAKARQIWQHAGNIVAIRASGGVISDYDMTERMSREFIRKVAGFMVFKPRSLSASASGITEWRSRCGEAGIQSGCRQGLSDRGAVARHRRGIDITKRTDTWGDIGGSTADIAVISLNGV